MSDAPFDPTGAVTFDLSTGRVTVKGSQPCVLVPSDQLAALCDAAGEDATRSLGRSMGEAIGKRARQAWGEPGSVSIERWVEHLAGQLALAGLGTIAVERWGRAMLLMVASSVPQDKLIQSTLETALEHSAGRAVRCVRLGQAGAVVRYLVSSGETARRVEEMLGNGRAWGEVLVELHGAASDGGAA